MLKWGKGEFRGGNDGPLWFLLRTRDSGPISEATVYTQKQKHWFPAYSYLFMSYLCEVAVQMQQTISSVFFFLSSVPSYPEIKLLLKQIHCLFKASDKNMTRKSYWQHFYG